jgi:excisionase family DNA binding protein
MVKTRYIMNTPKLLKPADVAEILAISKPFAYFLCRTGQLKSVRMGAAVRVRPEDLDAFIIANLAKPPSYSFRGKS